MRRQYGGKRIEFKDEVGMTRRDQLVINITRLIPHMTLYTFFCPFGQIAVLYIPSFNKSSYYDQCGSPARRQSAAGRFTTDAIFELKLRTTRLLRSIHGMTDQAPFTLLRVLRVSYDIFEISGHHLRAVFQ